jgi:hypothetical protein
MKGCLKAAHSTLKLAWFAMINIATGIEMAGKSCQPSEAGLAAPCRQVVDLEEKRNFCHPMGLMTAFGYYRFRFEYRNAQVRNPFPQDPRHRFSEKDLHSHEVKEQGKAWATLECIRDGSSDKAVKSYLHIRICIFYQQWHQDNASKPEQGFCEGSD